jgi:hypothetical protein
MCGSTLFSALGTICRQVSVAWWAVKSLRPMNLSAEPAALTSGLFAASSALRASFWPVRSWARQDPDRKVDRHPGPGGEVWTVVNEVDWFTAGLRR